MIKINNLVPLPLYIPNRNLPPKKHDLHYFGPHTA